MLYLLLLIVLVALLYIGNRAYRRTGESETKQEAPSYANRLAEGVSLEASKDILPWGAGLETIVKLGRPVIDTSGGGIMLRWYDEKILNGLKCDTLEVAFGDETNNFYGIESRTTDRPEEFERIAKHLTSVLGNPTRMQNMGNYDRNWIWTLPNDTQVLLTLSEIQELQCILSISKPNELKRQRSEMYQNDN